MSVVEYVHPDDRLVSERAAVPIFKLASADAPLPDQRAFYRTRSGRSLFAFTFILWSDGSYRAYIRAQPSYGRRSPRGDLTHRNGDSMGRSYVCWVPAPRSAVDVLKVARHWAERTELYIRDGAGFSR